MSRVTEWITSAAHPLATAHPAAPLTDLEPLRAIVGDASIVGVARGADADRIGATLRSGPFVPVGGGS